MFIVYSKPNCPYCVKAKSLLDLKKLEYKVINLDVGQTKDENEEYISLVELKKKVPGIQSVPQIFENDTLIGGFQQLQKHLG